MMSLQSPGLLTLLILMKKILTEMETNIHLDLTSLEPFVKSSRLTTVLRLKRSFFINVGPTPGSSIQLKQVYCHSVTKTIKLN